MSNVRRQVTRTQTHVVSLTVGEAVISEWHNEVAQIGGRSHFREVGNALQDEEEPWVPLDVGLAALLATLRAASINPWMLDRARLERQVHAIHSGRTVEAPVIYSWDDTPDGIKIIDGRHRLAALENLGAARAIVMVPQSQTALFSSIFA
jgi:hypothetical protein